jgi:hypothetical protein
VKSELRKGRSWKPPYSMYWWFAFHIAKNGLPRHITYITSFSETSSRNRIQRKYQKSALWKFHNLHLPSQVLCTFTQLLFVCMYWAPNIMQTERI